MHHGCYFHYCQSLYKHVQSLGLTVSYCDDEETRLAIRSTMALALLPCDHVEEAYELLKGNASEDLAEFFDYFQRQWLKKMPPKYWNASTLEFRTNNYSEDILMSYSKLVFISYYLGWHNKFNHRVKKHHPNVWHLLKCLQREELSFRQQLGKLNSGGQKKPSKPCTTRSKIDVLTDR